MAVSTPARLTASRGSTSVIARKYDGSAKNPRGRPRKAEDIRELEFLRVHWDGIAAADFFTVEALSLSGLTRYQPTIMVRFAAAAGGPAR